MQTENRAREFLALTYCKALGWRGIPLSLERKWRRFDIATYSTAEPISL